MSVERASGTGPQWRSDVAVLVGVVVALTIASQLADGTTRLVLMVGIAAVVGLLMRLSVFSWRRVRERRHGQGTTR